MNFLAGIGSAMVACAMLRLGDVLRGPTDLFPWQAYAVMVVIGTFICLYADRKRRRAVR